MDTIRSYVEGMFAALPKTPEMEKLKNEILANMEDKYRELKAQGCSENEAIGSVISNFGNIEELIRAYNIQPEEADAIEAEISDAEISRYLAAKSRAGKIIAAGVSLCILAPAFLVLISAFGTFLLGASGSAEDVAGVIGLCVLFAFIAVAVGMFIYAGIHEDNLKKIGQGVSLGITQKAALEKEYNQIKTGKISYIIIGVLFCVLSPLPLIILSLTENELVSSVGVAILLGMVAAGVPFFILYGTQLEGYERLLQIEEYEKKNKSKADKIIGAIGGVVWPFVTAIFLYLGFIHNMWDRAWVIFPIVGVIFGGVSALIHALTKEQD